MATTGFAGAVVSVIMSIVMAFSGLPVGSVLNGAENWDKDEIAAEKVQLMVEYFDAIMHFEMGGPLYFDRDGNGFTSVEEIPEGTEFVEVDMSSINNFLSFAKRVIEDETVYGGDFTSLDFSALDGKALKEDNALDLVYDAVQFLADNADAIGKVATADFDYGKLGTVLPEFFGEDGTMRNFNLYEIIMSLFLDAYSNGDYRTSPILAMDKNGSVRLAYYNNVYYDSIGGEYTHNPGECAYSGNENVFHGEYTGWGWEWNEETQQYEEVRIELDACYTALTEAEKTRYSADGKLSEYFCNFFKNMMMNIYGLSDIDASDFVAGMDFTDMGVYALIPAILNEVLDVGSDIAGDAIIHTIRQFFIYVYGGNYNGNEYFGSTGIITDEHEDYYKLLNYYNNHYEEGDYALFDYSMTIGGIEYNMFEASYGEDGSIVFYPYYESIKGKDVQGAVESIFDLHFAVPSDYALTEEEIALIQESGKEKFIGRDGEKYYLIGDTAYKLYESVFPLADDADEEVIASLTDADLIATESITMVMDHSDTELAIKEAYYKDGRFYICRYDLEGNLYWTEWTAEEKTTVCKVITDSLSALCGCIDPYYTYNDNQYDFIDNARELGGGFVEQINNIIGTLIENSWTEEAKAEFQWIKGGNEYLNDNIMGFIRFVTGKLLTPETTEQLNNLPALLKQQADDDDYDFLIYTLESLTAYYEASYYENTDLEGLVLDIILTFIDLFDYSAELNGGSSFFFENFTMPENITSLEAFVGYTLSYTMDVLFDDIHESSKYVKNGSLIDMPEEEWKNIVLDVACELFLRVWAESAEESAIVFTKEEIDTYKLKGWGYLDFLDELFDRFYVYVEGLVAVCDDLECEFGVLDGNGPWYKISKILNALLPVTATSDCSNTYGDETFAFDIGVFIEEGVAGNLLNFDLSSFLRVLTVNENGINPFYSNNLIKALLICAQNFINAILPGSIADEDIVSVDHLIDADTLAKVVKQLINALNERKTELIPVIISWFELFGIFETLPRIDMETGWAYLVREDEDGKYASIADYYGDDYEHVVPEEIDGLTVKGYELSYSIEGTRVDLPDTLKYFDVREYQASNNMYVVSENNPYFESVDGVLYDEDMTMILSYPYFKSDSEFVVPSTVKTVYAVTFQNNSYLHTLKISEGVEKILCDKNNSSSYSFNYISDIYVPTSVEEVAYGAFYYSGYITIHGSVNSYIYEYYNKTLRGYGSISFELHYPEELYVTLNTEKQAVKSNIYVYGYTLPGANIKVYDGDVLICEESNISGNKYSKWEANVSLYNPVDAGSYHDITVVAEKDGETVTSNTVTVYYEKNAVVFKEFKIVHDLYYSTTVTDETINHIHSMTWMPGSKSDFRVKIINSDRLSGVYLTTKIDGKEHKLELTRSENDYWTVKNASLGDPPGIIRIVGLVKVDGKVEKIQIGGDIKINYLIDPSGNVYEFSPYNPLEGVTATVQYYEEGKWVTWDAEYYEQTNPIITGINGGFKWIVPRGKWRVVCEKDGYETYISEAYSIPPEVTGLRYYMTTSEMPTVESCTYNNGIITVTYDQYMTDSIYDAAAYDIEGAQISSVERGQSYPNSNYSAYCSKTVKLYCTAEDGSELAAAPANVTINNVYNYNGIEIATNTAVVPTDLTAYYNLVVQADDTDVTVGDLVTLTLRTTDAMGEKVYVKVSNSGIFDTEYNVYDEEGTVISTEDVTIPETIAFDETGTATVKFAAGFEGNAYITFSVGGTTVNYNVTVNAKADKDHYHNYGHLTIIDSTCITAGYSFKECECGDILYTAYELAEHTPVEVVSEETLRTEATCRAAATYYYTCDVCEKVLTEGEILESGETAKADFFSYGKTEKHELDETGNCKNCPYIETEPQEECKHEDIVSYSKDATCTEAGLEGYEECAICHEILNAGTIIMPSHKEVTDEAVDATCTETGLTEGSHCEVCGEVIVAQETVDALGHKEVTDEAVDATCTETGLTEGSHCEACGEVIVAQETVDALGHKEVTDEAVDATCTETGLTEGSHCEVCGEVIVAQETVDALGHKKVTDEAVDATCTETGLTEGSHCEVCDEVIVAQREVAKVPHTPVVVNAKDATETKDGYTGDIICEECETVIEKGEVIPALGGETNECGHMCHKGGFSKIIWSIINFFNRLFKIQQVCECGVAHY